MKPLCGICGTRHEAYQGHVFASNAASNRARASNATASNVTTEGDRNGDRSGGVEGNRAVAGKQVQGAAEEVAQVECDGAQGVQRDFQRDVVQPAPISAPAPGQAKSADVANDGVECGLDSGGRGLKQRWSREAYNRYQREYMRKRRAGEVA